MTGMTALRCTRRTRTNVSSAPVLWLLLMGAACSKKEAPQLQPAVAPSVPAPLLAQLKPGGRMVIPVDADHGRQKLLLIEKKADGSTTHTVVLQVSFVPLTGPGVKESAPARK